jgi:predicted Zn-dependent peptidase
MTRTILELNKTMFKSFPLKNDPLGDSQTIKGLSRVQVMDFYRRSTVTENMVMTVAGNFDEDRMIKELGRRFAGLRPGATRWPVIKEEGPVSPRTVSLTLPKEQGLVVFGFQGPAIDDPDHYAMEVLDAIMGGGLSSRLFIKVRDEVGQAYTVGSQYEGYRGMGVLYVYGLTAPEKMTSVRDIFRVELEALAQTPVTDQELKSAITYIKGIYKMSLQTPAGIATTAANDELMGLGWRHLEKFPDEIEAVTSADVMRAAKKYLAWDRATIIMTSPKK